MARSIQAAAPHCGRVIVCGGGTHNAHLMERLTATLGYSVETSGAYGAGADWTEALAIAWLARARVRREPSSIPTVTGAREAATLGGIYSRVARPLASNPSELDA